ncbi:MAG: T9SS type A sorting domain-containing protein [Flavobacterium sp.]
MRAKLLFIITLISLQVSAQCWDKISSGGYHTIAIADDGTLWAWGYNNVGQLGDGSTSHRSQPVKIGTDSNWYKIATGSFHSVAIKTDGTLWAWGQNLYGQLGTGNTTNSIVPIQIGTETNWKNIAAGQVFTLAVKTNGSLWSAGRNSDGQLGINSLTDSSVFVQVGLNSDWDKVYCGAYHAMALNTSGLLYLWGDNSAGQLGLQHYTDRRVPTIFASNIAFSTVTANAYSTIAIRTDGKIWRAGTICPIPSSNYQMSEYITTQSDWTNVSIGDNFLLATRSDGTLWAIGTNNYGQFGLATPASSTSLIQVASLVDQNNIDSNLFSTLYLSTSKQLNGSGQNHVGQLGNGTASDSSVFGQITCPSEIVLSESQFDNSKSLSIFPNPVKNTLNISLQETAQIQKVVIYDVTGKQVKYQERNTTSINVEDLKSGFYLLEVLINDKSEIRKFIKQ